jgi:hypothetical protein
VRAQLFLDRNARGCAVLAIWTALGRLLLEELLEDVRNDLNHLSLRQVSRTSRECGVYVGSWSEREELFEPSAAIGHRVRVVEVFKLLHT